MASTTHGIAITSPDHQAEVRVDVASRRVHAAEGQLHTAHQSGVPSWQAAAERALHAALAEYLAARAASTGDDPRQAEAAMPESNKLHAVALIEANQPGWQVSTPTRTYTLWAPGPEVALGRAIGGAHVVAPARCAWAAGRDERLGDQGNFRRADSLNDVLAPLPSAVAAILRTVVRT